MKICVLWGSWRVWSHVIQHALSCGRSVTTLVRHPEKVSLTHPQLTIVQWDATNPRDILSAAQDCDIVIHTVSVWLHHTKSTHIYSRVTQAVIDVRPNLSARHYIVMSSTGTDHGRTSLNWLVRWWYEWLLWDAADDKEIEEQLLSDSDLPWTVIKAVRLTDWNSVEYETINFADYHTSVMDYISRSAVAHAICDIMWDSQYFSTKIVVY